MPFSDDTSDFLSALDFYVYFHSRQWVEAFGVSIAEAMASGVVTVLDPSYETLFEDGAVYTEASGTLGVIERFLGSPKDYAHQAEAGRRLVARKFSLDTFQRRMTEVYAAIELPLPLALKGAPSSSAGLKI